MKSFGAIFFLLLFSALAPAAPRGYHSPSYHRGGREAAADSLSKSRRIGLSDREVESYPDTAKVREKKRSCFVSPAIRETILCWSFFTRNSPARAECFD